MIKQDSDDDSSWDEQLFNRMPISTTISNRNEKQLFFGLKIH